jgi:hypothetical protein
MQGGEDEVDVDLLAEVTQALKVTGERGVLMERAEGRLCGMQQRGRQGFHGCWERTANTRESRGAQESIGDVYHATEAAVMALAQPCATPGATPQMGWLLGPATQERWAPQQLPQPLEPQIPRGAEGPMDEEADARGPNPDTEAEVYHSDPEPTPPGGAPPPRAGTGEGGAEESQGQPTAPGDGSVDTAPSPPGIEEGHRSPTNHASTTQAGRRPPHPHSGACIHQQREREIFRHA